VKGPEAGNTRHHDLILPAGCIFPNEHGKPGSIVLDGAQRAERLQTIHTHTPQVVGTPLEFMRSHGGSVFLTINSSFTYITQMSAFCGLFAQLPRKTYGTRWERRGRQIAAPEQNIRTGKKEL
jgi:hypothetical protein